MQSATKGGDARPRLPHMPVIDFAEPEPPEKSPPSAGDWLGLAILLALACGICFVVGMYFGKWVMA